MVEEVRKRGRPRLTDEEKRQRAVEKNARQRKKPGPKPRVPLPPLEEPVKRANGRPSGFRPEFAERARLMAKAGFTDMQMAEELDISIRTFYSWTARYPEFLQALKMGKEVPDEKIERTLFHKACGYSYETEKVVVDKGEVVRVKVVEHVPPDTTAMIFWLKNRRADTWRDKKEVELNSHEAWLAKVAALEGEVSE